jgi:gamma-glutamyl phosphate reductase
MPGAEFLLPKHIADLWKAAAELRVAASEEPENAAALRRIADQLEAQADDLEEANSRAKPIGFV